MRGEALLITLVVVFVIGGISAVGGGYLFAPACQYQPPHVSGPAVPYIPGK